MPKKNQIKFKNFEKALRRYVRKNFEDFIRVEKSGSAIRYELFPKKESTDTMKMWVVHKDEFVHKGDLKKTCENLGISTDNFLKLL